MPMDPPYPEGWNELRVKVWLESPTPVASTDEADRVLERWDALMGVHWVNSHVQFVEYEGRAYYDVKAEYWGGPKILRFPLGMPVLPEKKPEDDWCVYEPSTGNVYYCHPATMGNAVKEAELAGKGHHRALTVPVAREMANAYNVGRHKGHKDGYQSALSDVASGAFVSGGTHEAMRAHDKRIRVATLQGLLDLRPTRAGTPAGRAHDEGGWSGLVRWFMGEILGGRA